MNAAELIVEDIGEDCMNVGQAKMTLMRQLEDIRPKRLKVQHFKIVKQALYRGMF